MVTPDDISGFVNNRWFDSLSGLANWLGTIVVSIICLGVLYLLWNFLEHRIRITVFPVYGASDDSIGDAMKQNYPVEYLSRVPNIQLGFPRKIKGKRVKVKGVRKFQILKNVFSWKRVPDINYEYQYPEGMWMIEPKKDIFIPIRKPNLSDTINIKIPESDIEFWMQLENEEQLQRTKDESEAKRQAIMTAAIIIGAFVLAAIIIWLSMSFAGNTINSALSKMDGVTQAFNNVVQTKGPG